MQDINELVRSLPTGLFIDGQWREATGGGRFDVINPATGQTLTTVADATPEDGMAALDAAHRAQDSWAATPPRQRAELLRKGFEAVMARADDFALLMSLEMGKALGEARGEVNYGAEFLRWFSEQACQLRGGYGKAPDGVNRILVTKRPVGPSLLITPWNFPLAMATRKVAPAMAAGCTVVVKPAALTPLTTLLFAQVMAEVGVPAGVINVIPTTTAGKVTGPLMEDRRLRKLSFTGSTEVGRNLLAAASTNVLRTSMELGGNAPFVVFEDADITTAVNGAMAAKFRNIGQACTAANRFIVHKDIAEDFAKALSEKTSAQKVGPGYEAGIDIGPLVDENARTHVAGLVNDAVSDGAKIVTGGQAPAGDGYFYQPTVLMDVKATSRVMSEEIFGPVAAITTFTTEDEAVALANDSDFGLISYCFTQDFARMMRMAERLESGMIAANSGVISNPAAPFGGVKQSGLGREGGAEGIEEYLETVYVGIGGI
ncbi:MAG: NAD-dependent succinate-semialdehyde dehydrogenase [Actinomycetaceae bacterium]|nr:NAD-dependent succinate-semialdehyde dehydrogenase [Actinomycetaceae bacterium]